MVVINYLMPTGKTYKLVLEAADGDSYQGSFLCEESSPLGNWVAQSIEATDKAGNRAVIDQNLEGLSFGVYECPIEDIQVESGKDVTLGYRGTTLSIEFVSQNNKYVSCNRTGVSYSTGVSEPWTIEYTLMPREVGNTAVEVRNSSTGAIYKVYNVTVVQGHHNGCVGQDITFVFSSPVAQEYTLTSDKEGAALKKQSCKTTSISGGLSSLVSNQIECVLRFDSVEKYNIVLTGNVDNSPITLCFDVKQHEWKTEYTVDKEPTCTEEGSKSIHCNQCNAINPDSVESIEVKAHVPGAWEILSEATEDFNGVKVKYCTKCRNEVERASIPKIPTYSVTYDANGGQFSDYGENAHTYNRYSVRVRKGKEYVISTDSSITRDVDVTYHGNGGDVESPMVNHHSSYIFGFLGWNTKKDGSGMNYEDGSLYSGNEDITLYAQWKAHIFDELYSVKRPGYEFIGWYTQKQGGKKLTSETYITEDTDAYAHWRPGRFFLSDDKIIMDIGDYATLYGFISSEQDTFGVSWDYDVGMADKYVIGSIGGYMNELHFNAFHEGEVTIRASIDDSGIYLPPGVSKEAECKVTVKGLAWRLYETLLKRKPDMAGWKDWTKRLNEGTMTGAQVAEGFVFSDELINQKLSNEEFVERMYVTFLNRRSDPAGKAEWVSYLDNGVSRRGIFRGFAESSEFSDLCCANGINPGSVTLTEARDMNVLVTMFVSRCYDKALSRKADVSGLNTWCDILLNKSMTPKEVAYGFIFSQEMNNKNLSNEEYIKTLYRVFMDREADSGGLSNWMNWMNGGMSREEVFNGFADSVEFGKIVQSYGL